MRSLAADEQERVRAVLEGIFPARWGTWGLSVGAAGEVDPEGEVVLRWELASFSEGGGLLGAAESRRGVFHLVDLGEVERTRAYLRAVVASLPGLSEARGWERGEVQGEGAFAEVLPGVSLLEEAGLADFEGFLERLSRPDWLSGGDAEAGEWDLSDWRGGVGTRPLAVNPELEAEVAGWPQALWPFAKYARWLSEHGDPQGELIAEQVWAEDPEPGKRRFHERRWRRLLEEQGAYFLGPFAPGDGGDPSRGQVVLSWKRGFVERATLELELDVAGPEPGEIVAAVLGLASCRLVRELVLSVAMVGFEREDRHGLPRWTECLAAAGGGKGLRRVVLVAAPSAEDNPYLESVEGPPVLTEAEDLEVLQRVFPLAEVVSRRRGD